MGILKILAISGLAIVAYQDFKLRAVSIVLFPILAILLSVHLLLQMEMESFLVSVLTNIFLVSGILLILWSITKYLFKKEFLNVSFGLGDLLFFYVFALGFPTVTFILLFVSAIIFSHLTFLVLQMFRKTESVPLAGLMALYLSGILLVSFSPASPSLYIL
nr:hypothetical protein [Allomuricauda sp.]